MRVILRMIQVAIIIAIIIVILNYRNVESHYIEQIEINYNKDSKDLNMAVTELMNRYGYKVVINEIEYSVIFDTRLEDYDVTGLNRDKQLIFLKPRNKEIQAE